MAASRSQADEDEFRAWVLASNCLLYEADGGPDVNWGTDDERVMTSHAEATQVTYAKHLLLDLDADIERLRATAERCQQLAAASFESRPDHAQQNARAADLCERAAQMVLDFGAAGDDRERRRLIAICEHDTNILAWTVGGALAEDAKRELAETLAEIDAEHRPGDDLPDTAHFDGPTYDEATGRLRIGVTAEAGEAHWTLNTPGVGLHNGLIIGPPEIGKTNLVRIVLVEAILQPKFALWLGDPTGRHNISAGPFASVASRIATNHRDVVELLREAGRVVDARTRRGTFADPTTAKQGILVVIEDCHEVFADNLESAGLAEHVALLGGPVSVALIVTAPGAELAYYGGSAELRGALAATNCVPLGPNSLHMLRELGALPSS
jgi:hypothetical protein